MTTNGTAGAGTTRDRNVAAVIEKHAQRAATGLRKYGVTTERDDLSTAQWLQHLQDELMDGAVYVQRLLAAPVAVAAESGAQATFAATAKEWAAKMVLYDGKSLDKGYILCGLHGDQIGMMGRLTAPMTADLYRRALESALCAAHAAGDATGYARGVAAGRDGALDFLKRAC